MIFEKRLLVLGGSGGNGCLRLEKTDRGISCRLTGAIKKECVLTVRSGNEFHCFGNFDLSTAYTFTLPREFKTDTMVAAVGDTEGNLLLYGGFLRPLPWRSAFESDIKQAIKKMGITTHSKRIEDYFLDIIPTDYDDTKVAEVNYYKSSLVTEENTDDSVKEDDSVKGAEGADFSKSQDKSAEEISVKSDGEGSSDDIISSIDISADYSLGDVAATSGVECTEYEDNEALPNKCEEECCAQEETEQKQPEVSEEYIEEDNKEAEKPEKCSEEKEEKSGEEEQKKEEKEELYRPELLKNGKIPELKAVSFYESVKEQVEKLFQRNERYEKLEALLPDSKWIKVDYDASGKYYLVGTIGDPVRYLCYGVPGEYSPKPPRDLAGYCQWLAVEPDNPAGKGFWIMYQDGVTGKSVL